ncbi:hypothetical protein AUC70_04685 [Methyloceanibacter stevinii]|uniref:Uncharacterized protein n=1 Tax=Methyloceanibacter stevinii TaxID=1774970 RepID=A0A1E3VNE7_9HYPH|nr:hypothetical protein [Methyloceanibacter stevinii]ODR95044.1 hypothetical protein AUC70_04685 [Methyloceanibacter stevinii]
MLLGVRALLLAGLVTVAGGTAQAADAQPGEIPGYCAHAEPSGLPLPTSLAPDDYESRLRAFLDDRRYVDLGWCVDKETAGNLVRDTGPFIDGVYYGTHPAVRVYYSPEPWPGSPATGKRRCRMARSSSKRCFRHPPPVTKG